MKITGVKIEGYRSIDELTINSLSNMNIFVGKNNSGKSTILNSIEVFVNSLNEGLITKVLDKKDFHRGQSNKPINIACSLTLTDEKFDELITKMKEEYPQFGSGIEELRNYRTITVYTSSHFYNEERIYSYIKKIKFSEGNPFNSEEVVDEKNILGVDLSMIKELIRRDLEHQNVSKNILSLNTILDDIDSERYRRYKEGRNFAIQSRYRNNPMVIEYLNTTTEHSEFKNRLQEEIDGYHQEIENILTKETENEIDLFAGRAKTVPNHIVWLLNEIKKIQILKESERKKPIEKEDAERLLTLKTVRGGKERLEQVQEIVLDLLGVTIDAFKGQGEEEAEIDIDNFLVAMNGTGIREALRLVLDMEFSQPDLILIEEPEVHLHFELERKVFKYLIEKSKAIQVFLTTHSTGFIDSSEANNILLVKKDQSTSISNVETSEFSDITDELGITISSLLLSKVIVFVEGPTDEEIVRTYLDKFHPDISYSNVGIVRMTGIGNYQYYASSHALEVFNDHGLKTIFILDSDSRSDEEMKKIKERHPVTSELNILSKSCIENYFLNPSILLKFIQQKMINGGIKVGIPTEHNLSEIQDAMEEAIDSLYPETLRLFLGWKYLKPIYPINFFEKDVSFNSLEEVTDWMKKGIKELEGIMNINYEQFEGALANEMEALSTIWEQRKSDIVPGSKVIDIVCQKYGVRYKKKKTDIQILSQVITNDEWSTELKDILGRIAQLAI